MNNTKALVARIRDALLPTTIEEARPRLYREAESLTAAEMIEGVPRLPLVYVADVTTKNRDITGQTGSITATDPTGRGRTIQINRMSMSEYRLIPDDAVVRVTIEVIG